jgi:hypothetical protein
MVIDNIRLNFSDVTVRYKNDPADDLDENKKLDETCRDRVVQAGRSLDRGFFLNDRICSYSKFVNFLRVFLAEGLTAELLPCDANVPGCPNAKAGAVASIGHLCFDQTRSAASLKREHPHPWCGSKSAKPSDASIPIPGLGIIKPEFVLRSPAGVYKYVGKLVRDGTVDRIRFYTGEAERLQGRFIEISPDPPVSCFVSVVYDGGVFCVPQGAYATAMLIEVLQQLRNLSTSPNDLNSAFSARLINL